MPTKTPLTIALSILLALSSVLAQEIKGLQALAESLDNHFASAVECIAGSRGIDRLNWDRPNAFATTVITGDQHTFGSALQHHLTEAHAE